MKNKFVGMILMPCFLETLSHVGCPEISRKYRNIILFDKSASFFIQTAVCDSRQGSAGRY
jgi:hypothetical protein